MVHLLGVGHSLIDRRQLLRVTSVGEYAEGEYPPLPDNYLCNHSATGGVVDVRNDNIDDDLEVLDIDRWLMVFSFTLKLVDNK